MQLQKVLIFSALISANVVVWYEVAGTAFLLVLGAVCAGIILLTQA